MSCLAHPSTPRSAGDRPRRWAAVCALLAVVLLAPGIAFAAPGGTGDAADAPADPTPTEDDDSLQFRISLPTQADREAWKTPGFRLEAGLLYGAAVGLAGAPAGSGLGFFTRVGARLDRDWSLFLGFRYGAMSGVQGQDLLGLRYAVTAQPVLHLGDHLRIGFGVGVAGFVEGGSGREDPDAATRDALVAPYSLPAPSEAGSGPLPSCNGAGATAQLRLGWTFVLGPMSATSLEAMVDGQRSLCIDDTGRVEPDTATAIVRRQWWSHVGWTLGWSFTWR